MTYIKLLDSNFLSITKYLKFTLQNRSRLCRITGTQSCKEHQEHKGYLGTIQFIGTQRLPRNNTIYWNTKVTQEQYNLLEHRSYPGTIRFIGKQRLTMKIMFFKHTIFPELFKKKNSRIKL